MNNSSRAESRQHVVDVRAVPERGRAWLSRPPSRVHRGLVGSGLLLVGVFAVACGGDAFEPDPGASAYRVEARVQAGAPAVEVTLAQRAAQVCADLCQARIADGCQSVTDDPAACAGYCSFYRSLSEACQSASYEAFSCQLAGQPCLPSGCNDLLLRAEADCPDFTN